MSPSFFVTGAARRFACPPIFGLRARKFISAVIPRLATSSSRAVMTPGRISSISSTRSTSLRTSCRTATLARRKSENSSDARSLFARYEYRKLCDQAKSTPGARGFIGCSNVRNRRLGGHRSRVAFRRCAQRCIGTSQVDGGGVSSASTLYLLLKRQGL